MAYTQLSLTATPGKRYSFSAKSGATTPHTGLFTELSVSALPGARHSFSAKSTALVPHTGLFTELSVLALPGKRHSFTAKTEAEIIEEIIGIRKLREPGDDTEELIEILVKAITTSGILE